MAKSWLQKYATYEEEVVASAVGIVAFATGGQVNATQLLKKFNQIDTVASANDSVKLVPALIGKVQGVFNNTANDLTVYPATGEYIDGTINNSFVIDPGDYVEFRAYASGRWDSYAGAASGTGTVTSVSVVNANGFFGSVATANTTPAITITTTVTGILVGNGTSVSAAVAGDFPTLNQNTTGSAATLTTGRTLSLTGDVTYTSPSFNGSTDVTAAATIANDAVTYAKIQNVTTNRLLGRATAGAGDIEEITLGTGLSFTGTTLNAASSSVPTLAQVLVAGRDVDALGTIQDNLGFSAIEVNTHNLFGVWTTSASHSTPILNLTGSTSGTITIKPKAIGGTWTLTLPDNDGTTANDLFVTDGSGITSWASLSSLLPLTTRGDIMVRGAASNDRLALGASGTILRSNGTDLVYTTATYPATTTVNQILYSSSANVIGGNANLTYDGTTFTTPIAVHATSTTCPLLIGGTGAAGILTLQSTSHGTKGNIYFGSSTGLNFDETTGNVGLGIVPVAGIPLYMNKPTARFKLTSTTTTNACFFDFTANTNIVGYFGVENTSGNGIVTTGGIANAFVMNMRDAKPILLCTTDTARWQVTSSGHFLSITDNVYDIGASGATRPRTIYVGTNGIFGGKIFAGGTTTPTALIHLAAGTATANTAPLKLTAGTNLTTPENGAFEFDGTNLYFTTGGVRKTVTIV